MSKDERMIIQVGYTQDGLFGTDDASVYNWREVSAKFEEILTAYLREEWPNAIYEIENGIDDYHRFVNGGPLDDLWWLDEVVNRAYDEWCDWLNVVQPISAEGAKVAE